MPLWARLFLAIFAAWRVTHLLAREDGPAALIARFRARLGRGLLGEMLDCFYCTSVWTALPFAWFVDRSFPAVIVVWLAISGGACLLERTGQPEIAISRLPEIEGEENALLRSEESRVS